MFNVTNTLEKREVDSSIEAGDVTAMTFLVFYFCLSFKLNAD